MFARLTLFAAFVFSISLVPAAQAFSRSNATEAVSRTSLTAILRSMGMKVEDTTEKGGTPWLTVTTKDGGIFNVLLYVCQNTAVPQSPCEQVQFRMLWDNTKGRTADDVNKFHLEKVFGRGYLTSDGKMIGVEYPLHLKGRVNIDNVKENVDYFLRVTVDFNDIVKP